MNRPDEKIVRAVYSVSKSMPGQMAEIIRWVQESKIADIAALEALESDQRLHWIQGRMQTYNSLLEVMQKPNEFLLEFEEDKTGKEKSKRSMAAF